MDKKIQIMRDQEGEIQVFVSTSVLHKALESFRVSKDLRQRMAEDCAKIVGQAWAMCQEKNR